MNAHDSRVWWLDACRSLAIGMVMLSHGRHFLTPVWDQASLLRLGGFLGVELFFVLSGYLIGGILYNSFTTAQDGNAWVRTFLVRRWLRTLPSYYFFLLLNALLVAGALAPGEVANLFLFPFFLQNFAWPGPSVFGEAWSLAVEEFFYLLFPLCLLGLSTFMRDRQKVFVIVALLFLAAPLLARFGAVLGGNPAWDEGVRKVVVFRLDALTVGVLTGWLMNVCGLHSRVRPAALAVLAAATLGAVTLAFFSLEKTLGNGLFGRVFLFSLTSTGCALLLLAGLRTPKPMGPVAGAVSAGARLSYALYLSHMPVFHLVTYFMGSTTSVDDPLGALGRWSAFWAGSLGVAMMVERLLERPILAWRDKRIAL